MPMFKLNDCVYCNFVFIDRHIATKTLHIVVNYKPKIANSFIEQQQIVIQTKHKLIQNKRCLDVSMFRNQK